MMLLLLLLMNDVYRVNVVNGDDYSSFNEYGINNDTTIDEDNKYADDKIKMSRRSRQE